MTRRLADTLRSFRRPERWAAVLGPDPDGAIGTALIRRSYGVRRAVDPLDLLTRCATERLDIVVLASGVEDAVDACRRLRTSPHATGTFVVVIMGDLPAAADLDALQSAGANDFILGAPTPEALE